MSSVVYGGCWTALIDVWLVSSVDQGEKKALEPVSFLCLGQRYRAITIFGSAYMHAAVFSQINDECCRNLNMTFYSHSSRHTAIKCWATSPSYAEIMSQAPQILGLPWGLWDSQSQVHSSCSARFRWRISIQKQQNGSRKGAPDPCSLTGWPQELHW